jgi:hypothetical protein
VKKDQNLFEFDEVCSFHMIRSRLVIAPSDMSRTNYGGHNDVNILRLDTYREQQIRVAE